MGHYIPPQELSKFLKKCDPKDDAQDAADSISDRIAQNNKGYGMLAKMGWSEGASC
jgi:hypothetical protein